MDARRRRFLEAIEGVRIVALDTNACIYHLERQTAFSGLLDAVVARAIGGALNIVLSAIVQLELLVRPYASGDLRALRHILEFTEEHAGVITTPISREVVQVSAQIRAMTRLKLPDAMVVGAAIVEGADLIIGNDGKFDQLNSSAPLEVVSGPRRLRVPKFIRLDDYT